MMINISIESWHIIYRTIFFEIFPRYDDVAEVSQSFSLNLLISIPSTNK